ncbi:bifunctional NUDIX hydrolase/histidine phosphatase family protein [Smaragdicoccus niigatensis]|uniref:bifunctional NUDIX hydrolase/histidine phosphatase family protein n=1 Tax=Smaragdicoccus niigatensis TaxID=359359 RepID=UPI0004757806|nr:bifunctional NUDIX hydrolase/histidine phosphatase family protein [Smaragdicoccus niigatensis]
MASPNSERPSVAAAGAVVWRRKKKTGAIEIALIHRRRYDDWSLPKGKLEPGETAIVAAVREIREETGLDCRLGRHLRQVRYKLANGSLKRVDYWSAQMLGGRFTPNREVDQLRWMTVESAKKLLSYRVDRNVLDEFVRLSVDLRTIVIVRHALAGRRKRFKGDDNRRPLDKIGRLQAQALVPQLLAYGVTHVHSADPDRCVATVIPFAELIGAKIKIEPEMSERAFAKNNEPTQHRILELATKPGVRAVCSQGKVMPQLLGWWAERSGFPLPHGRTRKASMWVLSLDGDRIVAADYVDSPLPRQR